MWNEYNTNTYYNIGDKVKIFLNTDYVVEGFISDINNESIELLCPSECKGHIMEARVMFEDINFIGKETTNSVKIKRNEVVEDDDTDDKEVDIDEDTLLSMLG